MRTNQGFMLILRTALTVSTMFVSSLSIAQVGTAERVVKHGFFTEYNTSSTTISINYERWFSERANWFLYYCGGIGIKGDGIGLPLGVGAVGGKGTHHPEISFVAVPYVQHALYLFKEGNRADKQLYLIPSAGYRFSPPQSRFFAKALAGPSVFLDPRSDNFWKMDGKIELSLSVGAGYRF